MIDTITGPQAGAALSFDQLMQAAEALIPLIEQDADEAERIYHQTDRVVAAMRDAGLCPMLAPQAVGGHEVSYVEAMRVIERLAWVDGSSSWCLFVMNIVAAQLGGFLPDDGAKRVFANGAHIIGAGQGVPRGFARPVDGGYMVKGRWGYGSAIWHSEWIHSGCFVMDGDKMKLDRFGKPEIVLVHHPRDQIELKDNWDVLGLRGTGSYDYEPKDEELFVPADMCWLLDAEPFRGKAQSTGGVVALSTWGHSGWILGVGRRVLDELKKLAGERRDAFGLLRDSPSFRQTFAEMECKFRAARGLTYDAWNDLCETYDKGGRASLEQMAVCRAAMRYTHDVMSDLATQAHRISRGVSLRPSILQRCYRDIHAGTQHIFLSDQIAQDCGMVLLGAAPANGEWLILGVRG